MPTLLHQRQQQQQLLENPYPISPSSASGYRRSIPPFGRTGLLVLLSLTVVLGVLFPWMRMSDGLFSRNDASITKWRDYTLAEAVSFVAKNGTVIVCAVSQPYLPFLNNWLISIARQKHQEKVLVIAEDYATLYKVNQKWPGHAILIPPAPDAQTAHKFGSQGFFNFTSRRPRHLLQILELGYNVMYNDVDMVWLADPFPYLQGYHDVYFTDDMAAVKPLNHSHALPAPGKKGRTYICSCMIFLHPTSGAKQIMRKWIEELQDQPWSKTKKSNDQPAFNWALNKTAGLVDLYLLPQVAFPSGGLYFKNQTWVQETKGLHVIIHNNYITGFEKKIKRFRDFGLWLVDDHSLESPLATPFLDVQRGPKCCQHLSLL
ncbi:UDP-D-xylose:L-fucose alpha-1,3-D-xylosyltransferase MGP4-like isoform X2 [Macadamia integrifolia]|uniref:UDP-D-xylose:L-fucose alpha-1,3-D-xylosyltransferase MGP4-like isoform X2 n=1 Tax=Macadamia integrifolia TaxID=60698 RepID=UPI001C4FEA82|nr:UDP-D-xylose:L-fucose alpha-1,3-D-xylosyltransferase MGP4-like isoform X2 [Macadamia integrifolia]